ncbi:MAG: ABC transporter substrate-binding protein [Anaerolineaceae bacterium]|nr:ABC transporter substrate-binding protein [Anaerolineaceae bacterium]
MAAKWWRTAIVLAGFLLLAGCAPRSFDVTGRVALLGPFEGRYQEVGYNALYAARLAAQDAGLTQVELIVIDDGGTPESAASRARALARDPLVKAVLLTGFAATSAETQIALGDVPALIIGDWYAYPETNTVFKLANGLVDAAHTTPKTDVIEAATLTQPVVGGEVFALAQFPRLTSHLENITIYSSASLPDTAFAERYRNSGLFVPEPGLLATLTYDATRIAFAGAAQDNRAAARDAIAHIDYTGLNGTIRFENQFWADAPVNIYRYNADGQLIPVEGVIK